MNVNLKSPRLKRQENSKKSPDKQLIKFRIVGVPAAKGRPRVCMRGRYPVVFNPRKTSEWEKFARLQSIPYRPKEIFTTALRFVMIFLLPRPKNLPKKHTKHIKRPDLDNLIKAILDALQGVFYKDDSQIVTVIASKIYSNKVYGVEISIDEV